MTTFEFWKAVLSIRNISHRNKIAMASLLLDGCGLSYEQIYMYMAQADLPESELVKQTLEAILYKN